MMERDSTPISHRFIRRLVGPLLIALTGAAMALWTWDSCPDAIVDFGREVYVPWRLSEGEVLYRDINYFNGPFSPYFNAGVFKLFGASLRTLKLTNLLIIALAAALLYHVIAQVSDRIAATSAAILFMILSGFAHLIKIGNFSFFAP